MVAQLMMLFCAVVGDDPADGYRKALASGERDVQVVKEFVGLFPKDRHRITYYTGQAGKPRWTSTVSLYRRYVLHVQFNITFDESRTKIVKHEQPEFHLMELEKVTWDRRARTEETEWGTIKSFGPKEWQKVVAGKGDLEILSARIKRDEPVEGFEEYFERNYRR
jgi:hypothetical protein